MKVNKIWMLAVITVITIVLFGCTAAPDDSKADTTILTIDTSTERDTDTTELLTAGADTSEGTDTLTDTDMTTVNTTETIADTETEVITESETETDTETEPEPEIKVTPTSFSFYSRNDIGEYINVKDASFEINDDDTAGSVLSLTPDISKDSPHPYILISYSDYMRALSLEPADAQECVYLILHFRVENGSSNIFSLRYKNDGGTLEKKSTTVTYDPSDNNWQSVIFNLSDFNRAGKVGVLRMEFFTGTNSEETMIISSIEFASDKESAMMLAGDDGVTPVKSVIEIKGLTREYTFLQVTDLHSCEFTDDEEMSAERLAYITQRRAGHIGGIFTSGERMPYFFNYADSINADLMLLTGDMIDFPSKANLELLHNEIAAAKTKSLYVLGNHDWSFADDYQTTNAKNLYMTQLYDISDNDPYFHYIEYEDLIVCAVDDDTDLIREDTVTKFKQVCKIGKPVVVILHVPLHVDTLTADCTRIWGRDITIGVGGLNAWDTNVCEFYSMVAQDPDTPVVAVISGHLHFNHEDTLPNGVPQYVTEAGHTGACRVITLKPASAS